MAIISKKNFIKIMDYIHDSSAYVDMIDLVNTKFKRHTDCYMGECFVDYNLEIMMIGVLEEMFNDKEGWISYWVNELECGDSTVAYNIEDTKGISIDISTAEKFYDFLIKEYNNG